MTAKKIFRKNILSFSLFDCKASDGSDEVALYNDHCPIEEIKNKINLKWNDYASFDISVFQMASSNRLVPNWTNCIWYIYIRISSKFKLIFWIIPLNFELIVAWLSAVRWGSLLKNRSFLNHVQIIIENEGVQKITQNQVTEIIKSCLIKSFLFYV